MNQLEKKVLKQFQLLKDDALTQTEELFPEKFYSVADFFLTNPIFQSIINEIDQERVEDYAAYEQMATGILRLIDYIYRHMVDYFRDKTIPIKLLTDINFISASKGQSLVEIFRKVWSIKRASKEISYTQQHELFISELNRQVILLESKLNQLCDENERLRKLEKRRLWVHLRRFRSIVAIYNSNENKVIKEKLIASGEITFNQSLDIRYRGLDRCLYEKNNSYNENFGMQDDKIAIQEVYNLATQKLGEEVVDSLAYKKMRILTEAEKICVFVSGEKTLSIKKNSKRGKILSFFQNKKESDTEKIIKALKLETVRDVINGIKDLNKLFNQYGITSAFNTENIPSHFDKKIKVSKNPQCWA